MIVASVIQNHVVLIVGGYAVVLGSFGAYAWRILSRGRKLASRLPAKDKPWT
jgi:hypothetical protein